ncbi:uncharacterized protein [Rutidosis leptorrhynchoides]|uniref:uncharacterized protein n=1 Tax=Rutidosis leptorrhynchoides TaxID=125765 RepID=UPI003A9988C0
MVALKNNKRKMMVEETQTQPQPNPNPNPNPNPKPKRNNDPGVRVVGGRIYDSQNGKTCHQCRQKTLDFSADCKNNANGKPCTLKYCYTCLKNRYGEKAEVVKSLDGWSCPRCRGLCNCSFCMKKRGHNPTGQLVQTAKANGFSSVTELLDVKGSENVGHYKNPKDINGSPKKQEDPKEANPVNSSKMVGKENIFNGKTDLNVNPPPSVPKLVAEKLKKTKRKGLIQEVDADPTKHAHENVDGGQQKSKTLKRTIKDEEAKKMNNVYKDIELVAPLPTGTELVTISGIDIPKNDAGNVLQFLEFCATFGKVLNIRKGQAEVVLRELIKTRSARRGKCSIVIQFHIQLLSFLQEDVDSECSVFDSTHGNNTWLKAFKSCVSDSKYMRDTFDCIDKTSGGYDYLDSSMKLKILNFLCDELLGTEKIRSSIDDQNMKLAEQRKEAKEKFAAARDKEKSLKQKMQDDVAKELVARNGAPLTIQEHESMFSKIKKKTAQAHAEMLECKKMVPNDNERPDAVRTEPIFRGNKGHVYWRLNCYADKSDILLQVHYADVGTGDNADESEKENLSILYDAICQEALGDFQRFKSVCLLHDPLIGSPCSFAGFHKFGIFC